jgi:hypothetical protein
VGLFKDVLTAFKPENLKRGLDAARNPPNQAEIAAAVAQLSPEQRAAYEANMAQVAKGEEESRQAWNEAKALTDRLRVLDGPAGRWLYGIGMAEVGSPDEINAQIAEKGVWTVVQEMRAKQKGEFKTALKQSFNISAVEQEDDPAERVRIAAAERAARDAARQPYNAPVHARIAISRLATRGETQLAELLAHLTASGLASRPDHVFGVYRVPDRISGPLTPQSEKGRVVEWDIVHTPLPAGEAGGEAPCVTTSFVAEDRWVGRRIGEPSILDEDLALDFCAQAGIGPELCLGLARVSEFRTLHPGPEDSNLRTIVKGVVAVHPPEHSGAYLRMRDAAPLDAPDPASHGVHMEVLNWEHVGRAVHPKIHHPPSVPSPFPYLPSTPQELLRAYLEVVGVRPADCYSAQATVDHPSELIQGGFLTTNLGPKQPCADGKERMRTHACEWVIVAYRDRPEYAQGRGRWAAYQRDVLMAHLENGMRLRPRLTPDDLSDVPSPLRGVVKAAEAIDQIERLGIDHEWLPPYRYCWPPVA